MKKISILLGVMLALTCLGGCSSSTTTAEDTSTTEETTTNDLEQYLEKVTYLSDDYQDLWHTWYSDTDIIEFTNNSEFYWTCDDIGYCVSGTYTVDETTINVTIDTTTIRSQYYAPTDGSYYYEFVDGNLVLTLVDDETVTATYYTDKSIALGLSD